MFKLQNIIDISEVNTKNPSMIVWFGQETWKINTKIPLMVVCFAQIRKQFNFNLALPNNLQQFIKFLFREMTFLNPMTRVPYKWVATRKVNDPKHDSYIAQIFVTIH